MRNPVRIGKVRMKDSGQEIRLIAETKQTVLTKMLIDVSNEMRSDHIRAAGIFYVRNNGTTRTIWGYESGASDLDLLGGAAVLEADIRKNERS